MDTLQGCYRIGPHDCRYFAGLYLMLRISALVLFFFIDNLLFYSAASALLMLAAVLVAIFKPYRNSCHSISDVVLLTLLSLAALCLATAVEAVFVDPMHSLRANHNIRDAGVFFFQRLLWMILLLYGFLQLLISLVPSKATNYLKSLIERSRRRRRGYSTLDDEVPHRLLN
jgi:magnesium-transporting ATPase (P-type)